MRLSMLPVCSHTVLTCLLTPPKGSTNFVAWLVWTLTIWLPTLTFYHNHPLFSLSHFLSPKYPLFIFLVQFSVPKSHPLCSLSHFLSPKNRSFSLSHFLSPNIHSILPLPLSVLSVLHWYIYFLSRPTTNANYQFFFCFLVCLSFSHDVFITPVVSSSHSPHASWELHHCSLQVISR